MKIEATGNNMKSYDKYDVFLEVTGPYDGGNTAAREVHLKITSNDGDYAQGWFGVDELKAAIDMAGRES